MTRRDRPGAFTVDELGLLSRLERLDGWLDQEGHDPPPYWLAPGYRELAKRERANGLLPWGFSTLASSKFDGAEDPEAYRALARLFAHAAGDAQLTVAEINSAKATVLRFRGKQLRWAEAADRFAGRLEAAADRLRSRGGGGGSKLAEDPVDRAIARGLSRDLHDVLVEALDRVGTDPDALARDLLLPLAGQVEGVLRYEGDEVAGRLELAEIIKGVFSRERAPTESSTRARAILSALGSRLGLPGLEVLDLKDWERVLKRKH